MFISLPIIIIDLSVGNLVPPFSFNEINMEFLQKSTHMSFAVSQSMIHKTVHQSVKQIINDS